MAATLAAQRRLRHNGIVSITAGAWEGQRLARVALLGGTIELAVGAPGLARLAGAALLPVFTVRGPGDDVLRVIVEASLAVTNGGDTDAALDDAARAFAARLEPHVRRYPTQWRDCGRTSGSTAEATGAATAHRSRRYCRTSSALTSIDGGTVTLSARAVFALMTSSKRVGCSTGMTAGRAPFLILSK